MWAEAPHHDLARSLTPGLLSSSGVTLVSKSCPNWKLDRTNTISIVAKAVDGLACCERAAEGRKGRDRSTKSLKTDSMLPAC